ncbi:MAG TPA: flagellar biosynthesis anti-sigma factor FlgM [Gemmatimonadales bacterium]|nr:flagellar biosynthesis anti-sigma factor FlgM [Gemmatimonadales bacterium]
MRIDRTLAEARQAELAQQQRGIADRADPGTPTPPVSPAPPVDRVEISDAGRAMTLRDDTEARQELSPERLEELRERIRSGLYDDPATALAVAQRLLASGDL